MTTAISATPTAKPTTSGRIIALDILRGYFILIIASAHLHYYPSLLASFTGRGQLWTSEAEGFFFISGMVIGIIRQRDMLRNGLRVASVKLWRRAGKLYIAASVLSIAYLSIAALAAQAGIGGAKAGPDLNHPIWQVLLKILTLQYSYGWADFLIYYVGFMLFAPAVLYLLRRRRGWMIVVGLATAVWIWRWTGDRGVYNSFYQWQMYFYLGMVIGYHWQSLNERFSRLRGQTKRWLQRSAVVGTIAIYVLGMIAVFIPQHYEHRTIPAGWLGGIIRPIVSFGHNHLYNVLLIDGRIGLLRPLALLVVFGGLFTLVRRYEAGIMKAVGWLLVPFGSNSLYVYIVESVLLFAIPFFLPQGPFWRNSLLELGMVGIIWLALKRRFLFRIIPR